MVWAELTMSHRHRCHLNLSHAHACFIHHEGAHSHLKVTQRIKQLAECIDCEMNFRFRLLKRLHFLQGKT